MGAKDILEQDIPALLTQKPELARDINAVIHFNITGVDQGIWTLDLTKHADWVKSGAEGRPR